MIRRKKNDKAGKTLLTVATMALLMGLIGFMITEQNKGSSKEAVARTEESIEETNVIYYQGQEYIQNPDVEILLVFGLDKFEDNTAENADPDYSYNNNQQADFVAVIAFDQNTKKCRILQLNRDSMCEIDYVDPASGETLSTVTAQLALAHTYGSGGSDSCIHLRNAVEKILYDIEIDDYLGVYMDAVPIINDAVGGVTVVCTDDMTAVDPSLVQGAEVTLMGDLSLSYVRERYILADNSNIHRMERQRQYLIALEKQLASYLQEHPDDGAKTLFQEVSGYIDTNVSTSRLQEYFEEIREIEETDILYTAGENIQGDVYMEFYPDENELLEQVIELFCIKKTQ